MDDSLYDEFGNYLGPDLEEEDDDLELEEENNYEDDEQLEEAEEEHVDESSMMQIDGTLTTLRKSIYSVYTNLLFFTRENRHSNKSNCIT